jgi:hypothetical protein
MEAGAFYRISKGMRFGFMKGHIRRGFELFEECTELLAAEKPVWALAFAPCHPTGAVFDGTYPLSSTSSVEGQIALLNGGTSGTLDDSYSLNVGVYFHLPPEGMAVSVFYNPLRDNTG